MSEIALHVAGGRPHLSHGRGGTARAFGLRPWHRRRAVCCPCRAFGAGKSTLLHLAGLLERPDGGEVYIAGQATTDLSDKARARLRREEIGFVYQFHHLLPEFTALENVTIPQLIRGHSEKTARARAKELLDFLGLGGRLEHRPAQLSVANSSASPSPAPWPMHPAFCWRMSRPAILIRKPPITCSVPCLNS